jgi:hypothetical protein
VYRNMPTILNLKTSKIHKKFKNASKIFEKKIP